MNELSGMLNNILSNPDEMKKIMDMANQIMGSQGGETPVQPAAGASSSTSPLDGVLAEISKNPEGIAAAAQSLLSNGGLSSLLGNGGLSSLLGNGGLSSLLGNGGLSGLLGNGGLSSLLGNGGLSGLLGNGGLGSLLGKSGLQSFFNGPTMRKILDHPIAKRFLDSPSVSGLVQGGGGGNDKKELIRALKPWLSEARAKKLDRAVVFAKVMRVAGATALIGGGQANDQV